MITENIYTLPSPVTLTNSVKTIAEQIPVAKIGNRIEGITFNISVSTTEGSTASTGLSVGNSIYTIEFFDANKNLKKTVYGLNIVDNGYVFSMRGKRFSDNFNGVASGTANGLYSDLWQILDDSIAYMTIKVNTKASADPNSTNYVINSITIDALWSSQSMVGKSVNIAVVKDVVVNAGQTKITYVQLGENRNITMIYAIFSSDSAFTTVSLRNNNINQYTDRSPNYFINTYEKDTISGHKTGFFFLYYDTLNPLAVNTTTDMTINAPSATTVTLYIYYE